MMTICLVSRHQPDLQRGRGLIATGLNALPPGGIITVKGVPLRPPERELGANYTLAANSTVLVNTTYAVPAL